MVNSNLLDSDTDPCSPSVYCSNISSFQSWVTEHVYMTPISGMLAVFASKIRKQFKSEFKFSCGGNVYTGGVCGCRWPYLTKGLAFIWVKIPWMEYTLRRTTYNQVYVWCSKYAKKITAKDVSVNNYELLNMQVCSFSMSLKRRCTQSLVATQLTHDVKLTFV